MDNGEMTNVTVETLEALYASEVGETCEANMIEHTCTVAVTHIVGMLCILDGDLLVCQGVHDQHAEFSQNEWAHINRCKRCNRNILDCIWMRPV